MRCIVLCFVVVCTFGNVYASLAEQMSEITQLCCNQGSTYARNHTSRDCKSSIPPDVPPEFGSLCMLAMDQCCREYFEKDKDCKTGVDLASGGAQCSSLKDSQKICCDECAKGRLAGSRGVCVDIRRGSSAEEVFAGNAFAQCCQAAIKNKLIYPSAAHKPSTVASMCDEYAPNELCAHNCIPVPGSYKCECNEGYQLMSDGRNCKAAVRNRCKPTNMCQHKCLDTGGPEVKCSCKRGYELMADKKSCQDIDECSRNRNDMCHPDSECYNVPGSYKCIPTRKPPQSIPGDRGKCPPGFKKNYIKNTCDDINECELPNPPCPSYLCVNTIGAFTCSGVPGSPSLQPVEERCPRGYQTGASNECEDIDECATQKDDCNPLSQFCINSKGSFYCQDKASKRCLPGFKINARTGRCEDINECEEPDICRDQTCVNVLGAYDCVPKSHPSRLKCPEGMRKNARTNLCEDIDECAEGTHLCDQHQNCLNTNGSHECNCKLGFELHATTGACIDINECATEQHDCVPQAQRCDNTVGSFICVRMTSCGTGYTLHAYTGVCEDIDECVTGQHNCARAGKDYYCVNMPGTFKCAVKQKSTTSTTTLSPDYIYEYYDVEEEVDSSEVNSTSSDSQPVPETHPITTTTPPPEVTKPPQTTPAVATEPSHSSEDSSEEPITNIPERAQQPERPVEAEKPKAPERPQEPEQPREADRPSEPEIFRQPDRPQEPERPHEPPHAPEIPKGQEKPPQPNIPQVEKSEPNITDTSQPDERTNLIEDTDPLPVDPLFTEYPQPTKKPYVAPKEPKQTDITYYEPRLPEVPVEPYVPPQPDNKPILVNVKVEKETATVRGEKNEDGSVVVDTNDVPKYTWTKIGRPVTNCKPGFEVNSFGNCIDIDECATNRHSCSGLTEKCTNTIGGYLCECAPGFRRDLKSGACAFVIKTTSSTSTSTSTSTTTEEPTTTSRKFFWGYPDYRPQQRPFMPRTLCDVGYHLNSLTGRCDDINECKNGQANCAEVEICVNTEGGYKCECPPNWILDRDRHHCVPARSNVKFPPGYRNEPVYHTAHDDIMTTDKGPKYVQPQISQVEDQGSIIKCPWGYKLAHDGACEDIDECQNGGATCGPTQICRNLNGGYTCSCPRGFNLVGDHECADVDECSLGGDVPICSANAVCVNTPGSYQCRCNEGYMAAPENDKVCVDVDECSTSKAARLCQHRCINVWGSYRCSCHRGYRLNVDNITCSDIDECAEYKSKFPCVGKCFNEPGGYRCDCPPGYRLHSDKKSCIDIDECETGTATCAPGGGAGGRGAAGAGDVCLNTRGGYRCHRVTCPPGYRLESRHRCKKVQSICPVGDWECAHQPTTISYQFFTFVSNLYIPDSKVDLYTMRGPEWANAQMKFELRLLNVDAPPSIKEKADINSFLLTKNGQYQAIVSVVKSLEGPQSIELELSMELYDGDLFGGTAVARLFIHVSEYEF